MKPVVVLIVLVFLHPTAARAETLELKRHTFGSAGATLDAGVHHLNVTIGQPVIGRGQTGEVAHNLGFWGWTHITTGIHTDPRAVLAFDLLQNVPNPFNPATTISFTVGQGPPVHVTLSVYDVRGALVTTLVDRVHSPARYRTEWAGLDARGGRVASGVYFYQLRAGAFVQTKKLVLLK